MFFYIRFVFVLTTTRKFLVFNGNPSFVALFRRACVGTVVKKIKTHFMFNTFYANRAVCEIMSKIFGEAREIAKDNMAHALCMPDN